MKLNLEPMTALLQLHFGAIAAAFVLSCAPVQAASVNIVYNATLTNPCPLSSGCQFGSGPEAINAAENDFITADLFISFRLDTSTPIFDIAAGENVPGLSVPPPERLVSYDASAISNLVATFAGVDLVTDPRFGLSSAGFDLGPIGGIVPGTLLIEGVNGVGEGPELDMIFGTAGPTDNFFVGSFISAGNTRLFDRNIAVNVENDAIFGFGDANGAFNLTSNMSASFTVTPVPVPGAGLMLLSGLSMIMIAVAGRFAKN